MGRAGGMLLRLLSRLLQLLLVLATLAIVVVMVLGGIATQRSWPQTTGVISLAGLHQPLARDQRTEGLHHVAHRKQAPVLGDQLDEVGGEPGDARLLEDGTKRLGLILG